MKKKTVVLISILGGVMLGANVVGKTIGKALKNEKKISDKHLALFLLMNQWVNMKQKGKNLALYFDRKGYKRIAIYGMSYVGERLIEELKGTDIEVLYAIDKNASGIYCDIDIVSVDDTLEEVDAIVVTAITFFDEIENQLSQKLSCPIKSLEDILYEI